MNSLEVKLIFIIILIFLIGFLIYDCIRKSDNFKNDMEYLRIPPHQELLTREQLLEKNSPMETQYAPDFNRKPEIITPNNAISEPNGIYRQRTGRQNQPVEHYVNIYDSNFGGIIPTSLGLKEYLESKNK
jgi:hypothetical protein